MNCIDMVKPYDENNDLVRFFNNRFQHKYKLRIASFKINANSFQHITKRILDLNHGGIWREESELKTSNSVSFMRLVLIDAARKEISEREPLKINCDNTPIAIGEYNDDNLEEHSSEFEDIMREKCDANGFVLLTDDLLNEYAVANGFSSVDFKIYDASEGLPAIAYNGPEWTIEYSFCNKKIDTRKTR